jgi:putative endonuclease
MPMKRPCLYIIANKPNGTLYVGVTIYLPRRNFEHQNKLIEGFSKTHNCKLLVYVEFHDTMEAAIVREKLIKKWHRKWKLELIESTNPNWKDLSEDLI